MILINKTVKITDISPIKVLICGYEACDPKHGFGPAIRDYRLLHFVVSGKGRFTTSRGKYDVGENELFIISPQEITYYEADEKEPWRYIWIGFEENADIPAALKVSDVIYAPYLRPIFEGAFAENAPEDDGSGIYEAFLTGLVMQLLALVASRTEKRSLSAHQYVVKAMAIIENEYQNRLTVSDIASRLHLNRSYFSEVFFASVGVSPHAYLTDIRMKKAAELLTRKSLSPSVVALSVGYPDVFSFSRAFKKYYSVSPTKYSTECIKNA